MNKIKMLSENFETIKKNNEEKENSDILFLMLINSIDRLTEEIRGLRFKNG